MQPWRELKRTSLLLGWMLLTGCSLLCPKPEDEPFICAVQPAYDSAGQDDTTSYRVNRACLRGVAARLKAAYKE